jgi:hypothetical protein
MEENYLDFGGVSYYIDFNALDDVLSIDKGNTPKKIIDTVETKSYDGEGKLLNRDVTTTTTVKNKEINVATYETLRMFLEIVLTYSEESDDTLGLERALLSAPLSFKISFNTLLKHGIIKEII